MFKSLLFLTIAIPLLGAFSRAVAQNDQASSILQKESIRRQELVLSATKDLSLARNLILEGKFQEASEQIDKILASVPNTGPGKEIHTQAKRYKANIKIQELNKLLEEKNWFKAIELGKEIVSLDPDQVSVYEIIDDAERILGLEDGKIINPAVDERFVRNLNEVSDLIKRGNDLVSTGQYDEAEKLFNKVIFIDPYNKVAAKKLENLHKKRAHAMDIGRKAKQKENANIVRKAWSDRQQQDVLEEVTPVTRQPLQRSNKFNINNKLKNIIIPEINFKGATIQDAVSYLKQQSQFHDPEGEGIDFILKDKAAQSKNAFSISLRSIPIGEALRYVTTLAAMKYRVEEYAVFIVSLDERSEVLVSREFVVDASFFEATGEVTEDDTSSRRRRRSSAASETTVLSDRTRITKSLEDKGVDFPEGATASYSPSRGILTVRNTQDQIDLVEELVSVTNSSENLLVKVEARFVEINQEDLVALTNNLAIQGDFLGVSSVPGTDLLLGDAEVRTNMKGIRNFRQNSLDRQIESRSAADTVGSGGFDNSATNRLAIYGQISNSHELAYILDALDQKKSTDLMTAPSVVVNNSVKGEIKVVREFIYPTDFDAPQIQQVSGDVDVGDLVLVTGDFTPATVIPAWPVAFQKQDVGVSMTVYPVITPDRKRVLIEIVPEVVQFDGFINYGSRIFDVVENSDNTFSLALANENAINQPVFSMRTIEGAKLEIEDGRTMVLGGLIREDIDLVDEKVPILGDLPLVGRAFRSEAERSIKKHLMIFVTVRIIRPDGQPYNPEA
ncbi:MAG: hypothetical protein AAGA18_02265 [Verrucomicrobiota bacterium]